MGTRHITAVQLDGQYHVAQYGQWDGYPEGQGLTALRFLREEMDRDTFVRKVRALREIDEPTLNARWAEIGNDRTDGFVSMDVAKRFGEKYPELSRDTGASILSIIQQKDDGLLVKNDIGFVADGLFCEWVWVIDLDANTFEGFKGFNDEPLDPSERFAFLDKSTNEYGYRPAKLVAKWILDELPQEDEFLKAMSVDDE